VKLDVDWIDIQRLMRDVRDDDALLDDLGSALPVLVGRDRALCLQLLTCRAAADSGPVPELVDTDTAVAVIDHAAHPWRGMVRTAGAAAVVLLALVGLGLMLSPITSWWWAVPVVGTAGLAGSLLAVIRMHSEPNWTVCELTDGSRGSA
jgi:hypothetical protein